MKKRFTPFLILVRRFPHYLVNGTVIFDTQSEEREQLVQQGTLLKSYQGLLITINE